MNTVVITDDAEFNAELSGLAMLADPIDTVSIRGSGLAETDLGRVDVALVDGRTDLLTARNLCALLRAMAPSLPILVVVAPSGLIAVNEHWCVDDVVVPGLSPAELDMRMRLAVSRRGIRKGIKEKIVLGDLVLDQAGHAARLADRPLNLTPTEFRLMSYLASHPGKAFTRSQLRHEVWDSDASAGVRTINVHVQRLRAKLGRDNQRLIDTVRGVGYMAPSPQDLDDDRRQAQSLPVPAVHQGRQQHSRTAEHVLAG